MKQVCLLALIPLLQTYGFSVLTDNSNSSLLDMGELESKNVDVFRQLLNQETIIRMALVKNVHALMKDMIELKQKMETLESAQQKTDIEIDKINRVKMATLQQEVNKLKRENQKLELENKRYEDIFNTIKENFTQINENLREFEEQFEERRKEFEKNTSLVLGDLKIEVRYLSVTLLDLNKHTLELDKSIPKMIERKYEQLSTKLNNSLETMNSDLLKASNKISRSVTDLKHSQNAALSSIFVDFNASIDNMKAELKQNQYDQLKLSSTVSALEVFRLNVTNNQCDLTKKVVFTAGVSSASSSWNSGTLVFDRVMYSIGGGYDSSTGVFTAPDSGHYVFFHNIQAYDTKYVMTEIVLNGNPKVLALVASGGKYKAGPNLAVMHLSIGDRVWVRRYGGSSYYTEGKAPATTFSGFKI
ncbi:probable protein phosphatase DDB_G0282105 [Saccostrea cucullata]|uniref:probable protein phosphatase DDB_G0282105 n=1 Tax=Saccostrea cuccullata TaxID=36930 RepID=UPI002ECFC4B2